MIGIKGKRKAELERYKGVLFSKPQKRLDKYFSEYTLSNNGLFDKHEVIGFSYSDTFEKVKREIDFYLDEEDLSIYTYK